MAKQKRPRRASENGIRRAAERLSDDPEKAGRSLPAEERAAFRETQKSVVDARRSAERREGLLRIN